MKIKSLLNKFSSKGFTLIELLVVIAILGVLAAIVLIAINPGQRITTARNSRVRADLTNLGSQANVFNADIGLANCAGGGSYPDVWGKSTCGITFIAQPIDPINRGYGMVVAPPGCAANSPTPCTSIAFNGTAFADPNSVPPVTNTSSFWCWRSSTGQISLVQPASNCTAP